MRVDAFRSERVNLTEGTIDTDAILERVKERFRPASQEHSRLVKRPLDQRTHHRRHSGLVCGGMRHRVQWENGKVTWPCREAMEEADGELAIF